MRIKNHSFLGEREGGGGVGVDILGVGYNTITLFRHGKSNKKC